MNFDPKLKEAAIEIEAIMRKHDIGGFISLSSQSHGEFVSVFNPSWSVIKQTKESIRILSRSQDFETKEAQRQANELTTHLVFSQADMAMNLLKTLSYIKTKLNEAWQVTHEPASFVDTDYEA